MLVSTAAAFIALQYRWFKLFRYPVLAATMIEPKSWKLGEFKPLEKWQSQMIKRGWTEQQINEAIETAAKKPAQNLVNKGNPATRYVHPRTGRSVVIDDVTSEVIHVGGDGFKY